VNDWGKFKRKMFQHMDATTFHQDSEEFLDRSANWLGDRGIAEGAAGVLQGQPAQVNLGVVETLKPVIFERGVHRISTCITVVRRAQIPVLVMN
jgi:hypothetical protein